MPLGDNLIRKTTSRTNKESKASNTNITHKTNKVGKPSADPKTDTYLTKKMTFYVKEDLLDKLYNFAYWDRHSITEAFNKVLEDGLKGKKTKPRQ
jgi:hypothetical protein